MIMQCFHVLISFVITFSGDTLSGTICCEKSKKDRRALSVSLNVINPAGQQSRKYCMS